ncbi:transcription factor 24 [Caerostris extrusa]|uniref:Transcription factor 24 n=1 Tax=Caerostris extrusa TaxID=172846 RepID=A0AAV4MCJ2_CAEEX|nr:transcription factor 24 [Caerostris extrusa]
MFLIAYMDKNFTPHAMGKRFKTNPSFKTPVTNEVVTSSSQHFELEDRNTVSSSFNLARRHTNLTKLSLAFTDSVTSEIITWYLLHKEIMCLPLQSSNGQQKERKKKSQVYDGLQESGMSRNAARERYRVKSLRNAFQNLQQCLPSVPPNTKLSKLDVLILATTYISHLSRILNEDQEVNTENGFPMNDFIAMEGSFASVAETDVRSLSWEKSYLHPVKKWPMRSRLYAGVEEQNSTIKIAVQSKHFSKGLFGLKRINAKL